MHFNLQMAVNIVTLTALFGMIVGAFRAARRVLRYVPLAYGALFVSAGYVTALCEGLGIQTALAAALATALCGAAAILIDKYVVGGAGEERRRTEGPLVAGFGILFFGASTNALIFGRESTIVGPQYRLASFGIGAAALSLPRFFVIIGGAVSLSIVYWMQNGTRVGMYERAVESDPELAAVRGVRVPIVRSWCAAWTGALCGLAGVLAGIERTMQPDAGLDAVLIGVIGATAAIDRRYGLLLVAGGLAVITELAIEAVGEGWEMAIYGMVCYLVAVAHRRRLLPVTV